jgi:hypothetical protein
MNDIAQQWLNEQLIQKQELLVVLDRMAEPDPVRELKALKAMKDSADLYRGTEFNELASIGPCLVRLTGSNAPFLRKLLTFPEQNWGWLASAEHIDLKALTIHWRERMLIEEKGQRSLYRFQDNRVLARNLNALTVEQYPLLLGPLARALVWDGLAWQRFENPMPGLYPAPSPAPWLLSEPDDIAEAIQLHNLKSWLWEQHAETVAHLAEQTSVDNWLGIQHAKAKSWGWNSTAAIQFLLEQQLLSTLAAHPAWMPLPGESAEQHLARCHKEFSSSPSTPVPSASGVA